MSDEQGAWSNWSGGVRCRPRRVVAPADEAEIAALIAVAGRAGETLRVAGAGHSFTPLVATEGTILDLARLAGIRAIDPPARQATIRAGTRICDLGEPLRRAGLGLANQGDVDVQAIGGAIGTGTHGTGRALGSLSTQLAGLRLITAEGDALDVTADSDPELFDAARVAMGMLGVATELRFDLLPAYRLHERTWLAPVEDCLAEIDRHIAENRHFEFFWRPQHGFCDMKTLNPTAAPTDAAAGRVRPARSYASPAADGRVDLSLVHERIDDSFRIFPSIRNRRFNEMEFAVPAEAGPACFREIRALMQDRYPEIDTWPIEYRTQAADAIFLSPAYGRASVAI
ncbi:MAG: FAD-binding protein [Alphaproteobacteria bacterium]|nr:FAD-binding protein [Alphaproteobacteria bacterium]